MEWLEKEHSQNRTQFDSELVITLEKREEGDMLVFKFRKNSVYKIISNEEYVVVAKDGNNIYFKESNSKHGFKIGNYTPSIKSFKIRADKLNLKEENLGEYNLEFDSKLGLHYICLYRKLEKSLSWENK